MRLRLRVVALQVLGHPQAIQRVDVAGIALQDAAPGAGGGRHVARLQRNASLCQQTVRFATAQGNRAVECGQRLRVQLDPFGREAIALLHGGIVRGTPRRIAQGVQGREVVAILAHGLEQAALGCRGQCGRPVVGSAGGQHQHDGKRQTSWQHRYARHPFAIGRLPVTILG